MKKLLVVMLSCIVMVSMLFGCANSESTLASGDIQNSETAENTQDSENDSDSKEDITVNYLTIKNEGHSVRKVLDALAEEYSEKEGINFKFEYTATGDRTAYLQKLRTYIASNEVPDCFDLDADAYTAQLAQENYLYNVGEFLTENQLEDKFYDVALDYQKLPDGSIHLLPTAIDIEVFWYNTEIFEDCGVSVPTTLDEFMDVCETIKEKGYTPIAVSGKEKWPLQRYLAYPAFRMTGNEFIDSAKTGNESFTSDAGMESIDFLRELGVKGYFNPDFAATDYSGANAYFLSGDAAILNMGSWELASFTPENTEGTAVEGAIDYFLLPSTPDSVTKPTDMWVSGGVGLGFNANTFEEKLEGFVKYMLSDEANFAQKAYDMGPFFPAINTPLTIDETSLFARMLKDADKVETAGISWDVRLDPVTNVLMGDLANALALGDISSEEFAERIDASIKENAPSYFE